jgi:hypothetical protein
VVRVLLFDKVSGLLIQLSQLVWDQSVVLAALIR